MTWQPSVIGLALKERFVSNMSALQLKQVEYGSTELIVKTPSVSINVDSIDRNLYGTGKQVQNQIRAEIFVHYSSFNAQEWNRIKCDEKVEELVRFLEIDTSLGGLVTFGYCSRIDPVGTAPGRDEFVKTGRIVWTATSVSRIPAV